MTNTKQPESDDSSGAPEWMLTFSDCMTLLLTFFVLLVSFSSFDDHVFRKLKVFFAKELSSLDLKKARDKDSFSPSLLFKHEKELDQGSEKPTLLKGSENNLVRDTEPSDFRKRKVFLIESNKIFWGKGVFISSKGKGILSTLASYLKEVPNRIVVSENGLTSNRNEKDELFGLNRSWAVIDYLSQKEGISKEDFSISQLSTLNYRNEEDTELANLERQSERFLEIVLLERSIYN